MYLMAKRVVLLFVGSYTVTVLLVYLYYSSSSIVRLQMSGYHHGINRTDNKTDGRTVTGLTNPLKHNQVVSDGTESQKPASQIDPSLTGQAPKPHQHSAHLNNVFQNFSISFQDLTQGKPPLTNNTNVNFKKFVVTMKPTVGTAQSTSGMRVREVKTSASPVLSPPVNPHPYNYTINQPLVCSDKNSDILIIIVVCSGLGNPDARMAIRETWGSQAQLNQWKSKMVFLLAGTNDTDLQARIVNESQQFRDIVQEDFVDAYRNLSLKSVAMLKWVTLHCRNAKFVLKTDDDMFINTKMLYTVLSRTTPVRSIIGKLIVGAQPVQNKNSKWYTPLRDFPGRVYPKYCSGTAYVISTDIVPDIYNITLHTPLFWLEDIYITGISAGKLKPRYVSHAGFTYAKRDVTGCAFQGAVSGHQVTAKDMYKIWTELQALKGAKCQIASPRVMKRKVPARVKPIRNPGKV